MKYVILSFDDGRLDTYDNAYKIISKYKLSATMNIVSDFIQNQHHYDIFRSAGNKAMTPAQLIECQQYGIEIACHGATHKNTVEDILRNIEELSAMGICTENIGFASPYSVLTEQNCSKIKEIKDKSIIYYIRSGLQIKREGLLYMLLSYIERRSHSKVLYYYLNKRNIIRDNSHTILKSAAVTKYTSFSQLKYFIERMKNNEAIIFMFHSILDKKSPYVNSDEWYWDKQRFEELCKYLRESDSISVITTKELVMQLTAEF